jgi:hypothetical protein
MTKRVTYWIGARPRDGRAWAYTEHGRALDDESVKESVFHMYRRYVKQWNDVELDRSRSLQEHTQIVCGASVGFDHHRAVFHWQGQDDTHWILEILFAGRFSEFMSGWSHGRNPLRTLKDIKSLHLHWSKEGDSAFNNWLIQEKLENANKGEWTEYDA